MACGNSNQYSIFDWVFKYHLDPDHELVRLLNGSTAILSLRGSPAGTADAVAVPRLSAPWSGFGRNISDPAGSDPTQGKNERAPRKEALVSEDATTQGRCSGGDQPLEAGPSDEPNLVIRHGG